MVKSEGKKSNFQFFVAGLEKIVLLQWRNGRVVDCGGLENR